MRLALRAIAQSILIYVFLSFIISFAVRAEDTASSSQSTPNDLAHIKPPVQPLAVEGPLKLPTGSPCPMPGRSRIEWVSSPKITEPIIAGDRVSITGSLRDPLLQPGIGFSGRSLLSIVIWDYTTSAFEGGYTLNIQLYVSPYTFNVPMGFPVGGKNKLIFGCFNDQQIFPEFANSYLALQPIKAEGPVKLQVGYPCNGSGTGASVDWGGRTPKITEAIVAGQPVNTTGILDAPGLVTGKLSFEVWDYATTQKEWATDSPLEINGEASPYSFQIPVIFPTAGKNKVIFACFNGSQIFPDFANSYSVADAPGGGGCVATNSKSDPTLLALLALAICALVFPRRSRYD